MNIKQSGIPFLVARRIVKELRKNYGKIMQDWFLRKKWMLGLGRWGNFNVLNDLV
jgi:hypothetical protein